MEKEYLAHIAEDGRRQSVKEHLAGTAELCREFASAFGAAEQGELAGLAHDIGKYSDAFQRRLMGGPRIDHSTAGAFECMKLRQPFAALAVAGHHGGLPDWGGRGDSPDSGSFCGRMNRASAGKLDDYSNWDGALPGIDPAVNKGGAENIFFTRMLYSCLVDADYLDTETFMDGVSRDNASVDMGTLSERFKEATKGWFPPKGELNRHRCDILKKCLDAGEQWPKGIFTLTVPTGGGKTASSLAFALEHAKKQGLSRIIYVIPYTSIIEQTAAEFRKLLGTDAVLEHHNSVSYDSVNETTPESFRMSKACENWDMPIIVTTAVQFFESLFSNRSSRCRKLHNIANSVIIFDEAQMLPLPYLRPCVWSIAQLVKNYGSSAVLCTATQPALDKLITEYLPAVPVREICPEKLRNWEGFKRVTYRKKGMCSWDSLCDIMYSEKQSLCIVNSRKNAQTLYNLIYDGEGDYHLSTLMCPAHRRKKLAEIRERLKNGEKCRVVSTSLIEAGVDVDFPTVWREEAGLDSVLQAAGRCNREGKRPVAESVVTVFKTESPVPRLFAMPTSVSRYVMERYDDFASFEAIHSYFKQLFELKGDEELDRQGLLRLMNDPYCVFPFETMAKRVQLIDSPTKTIYIPVKKGANLVERLRSGECSRELHRELSRYGVSVYEQHFKRLLDAGALEPRQDGSAILLDVSLYSDDTGLSLEPPEAAFLYV